MKNHHRSVILVADDHPSSRELLADWLEEEGHEVLSAEDGEHALHVASTEDVDLVLLDVLMPRRTGFSVCKALKASLRTRLVPVVLVTGLTNLEDRIQGIEAGADDFLGKPVNREELTARVRSLLKLKFFTDELESAEEVLNSLALSIEAKDSYTEGHCDRLSRYAVALARRLRLPAEESTALRRAGIVHDIGKVAVPEMILKKPGPLNADEKRVMEMHPITGERICLPLKSFRLVTPIIRHHHEKMDGSGYPDGLCGEAVPLTARILAVVDVYDALTTERPYRKALPPEEALEIMRQEVSKGWWDGILVEGFAGMLREPPRDLAVSLEQVVA